MTEKENIVIERDPMQQLDPLKALTADEMNNNLRLDTPMWLAYKSGKDHAEELRDGRPRIQYFAISGRMTDVTGILGYVNHHLRYHIYRNLNHGRSTWGVELHTYSDQAPTDRWESYAAGSLGVIWRHSCRLDTVAEAVDVCENHINRFLQDVYVSDPTEHTPEELDEDIMDDIACSQSRGSKQLWR